MRTTGNHCVGDAVFTYAIDSGKTLHARVDWRREGNTLLNEWNPISFREISGKITPVNGYLPH